MRYKDLFDAAAWRRYSGRDRSAALIPIGGASRGERDVRVQYGSVLTGKQKVWVGYFVQVTCGDDQCWLAEDPHSLRRALKAVEQQLNSDGLSLRVMGLDPEWMETGLSANSGYGYHPNVDGPVHMFDTRHLTGSLASLRRR